MAPKFEARWSNGSWKLFNTHTFAAVEPFYLQRDAVHAAERANARTN